ncbi:BACON domain-containing protein [Thermogemmatispora onikobensis]|uniref:BACON domain-containing protein n=1 Tax=Thermogemmatispora onikobensis TaxID=732234 RepID=UPI000852BEF2|nr:BACON domain-containing protein [Thermogemmatispora onikobensis]
MRWLFVGLAILALLLISLNGWLIRSRFAGVRQPTTPVGQPPFLTATPTLVHAGQAVHLHLDHFPAFAQVYFSYDVGQALAPVGMASIVHLGAAGSADVTVTIGRDWSPGGHTIQAEDVATHYTASTTVQVLASGPLRSPVLEVNRRSLDLGEALQGFNSVAPLWLSNGGDGSLSWTASSDQPWLLTTPTQGVLSERQAILIAGSRANLRPGLYHGTITFSADSGPSLHVQVTMRVDALPTTDNGRQTLPLTLTPAALAFSLSDGGPAPAAQFVTLANPEHEAMTWSSRLLVPPEASQDAPLPARADWLQLKPDQGRLAAGESLSLEITARGTHLLPGLYLAIVRVSNARSSAPAATATQVLAVSLTVLPACRLTLSSQSLTFTIGSGQNSASDQSLELGLAAGCVSSLSWQAFTSASWLKVDPASGRVDATHGMSVHVSVALSELSAGTYSGFILFSMQQRTQTVAVLLNLLTSAAPGGTSGSATTTAATGGAGRTPLGATLSPSSLSFTIEQGGRPPAARSVLLSAGQHPLLWSVTLNTGATPWLNVAPLGGTLAAGQTAQLSVSVNAANLTPGTYNGQFSVSLGPADGMPVNPSQLVQVVVVTLTVLAPCVLEVTPSSLSFNSSLLQPNPPPQMLSLRIDGGCPRPVAWAASVDNDSASWLHLSQASGSESGAGTTIAVYVTPPRLLLKTLRGQITITASDGGQNPLQSSPQVITVTVSPG